VTTTDTVAVIGLGYVGLPLALRFTQAGARVFGIDVDPEKIRILSDGRTYIKHVSVSSIAEIIGKNFRPTTDVATVREADAIIICVPTPLTKTREPDLSYVLNTARSIAPHLQKGALVVLESTSFPGTTDEDLRQVLEEGSGMKAGKDFHLAFSPEREDPGNTDSKLGQIPKVVG
jgi:UDP-N-acetyl-D-glucosamine dehydrogenase